MSGLLVVWTNIPESLERDFNEWYNREHMQERILGVPGFVRGRRFVAYEGGPRYLALYETRDIGVLHSEPYLALKRNFDPNSRRFVPNFRDTQKTAGEIVARVGDAEGGVVAVVPIVRTAGRTGSLRRGFESTLLPGLSKRQGVVAAWLAESTDATIASVTADVPRKDRILDALLVIEAMSHEDLAAAVASLDWKEIAAQGARPDAPAARLRVVYTVHSSRTA